MKIWKLIFIGGIIGIMFISGCTTQDSQVLGGVEDIKTNVLQAAPNVNSYTYTMTVTSITPGDGDGETVTTVTGQGAIDLVNKKVMTESLTPGVAGTGDTTSSIYVIDDIIYTGTEAGGSTVWTKENITDWSSYDQVQSQTELMDNPGIKRLQDETVNGVDCYVLEISPDLNDPSTLPSEYVEMSEIFGGFMIKQWIAKDTYYPKKIYMDMTMNIFGMSVTSESIMIFSDYNEPVTIELPEGAESAEWAPDFGF